jgi:hypothetical protein
MADNREWYRVNGATVVNEIIKSAGYEVYTKFDPVQDGYYWIWGNLSSDAPYNDPYTALQAFIIFAMRYSITKAQITDEVPF